MKNKMKIKLLGMIFSILLIATSIPVTGDQNSDTSDVGLLGAGNWPMYCHDLEHSAFSTTPAPETNDTLWVKDIGSSLRSSPAISEGMVYIGGSYDNKMYCLDANTGDEQWNYSALNYVWASPAVVDGKVYFGSFDNKVYCLDANTGDEQWNYSTGDFVISSPAVVDGKVYIGSSDQKLYCLDASNGNELWNYSIGSETYSSPAVAYGFIYFTALDGKLYCIQDTDGTHQWNFSIGSTFISSPSVFENKVYVGSNQGIIYCLDASDGLEQWNHSNGGTAISPSLAIAYGKIYAHTQVSNFGQDLYCLDAYSGDFLWNQSTGGSNFSSPSVADGKVYVGSSLNNCVYCIDAMDGSYIWSYSTDSAVTISPAIAHGRVYIGSDDGNVIVFGELNQPPEQPTILGPTAGGAGIDLNFSAVSTDPDDDQIFYKWDWGDGNFSDWLGPYDSGEIAETNYTWYYNRDYEVKVKAKDIHEAESIWSDSHPLSISDQIIFENIKLGFVYLRLFTFNKSFLYITILEEMGAAGMVTNEDLYVEANATEAVKSVEFTAIHLLWGINFTYEDDDSTDGFSAILNLSRGVYLLTISAFDENKNLIDTEIIDFFVFLRVGLSQSEIGQVGTRLRTRLSNT